MASSAPVLDISAPQIVVIAAGDSPSAQSNNKGHLFEKFVARLFEAYGCTKPTITNLNMRNNGYELDLVTEFVLSKKKAIAECKAYSSPLAAKELNIFYSKLCTERFDDRETSGWFIAIPGLTKDGHELARKIEANDTGFKLITATEIYDLVISRGWISKIQAQNSIPISDEAILITASGVCAIAKQLDAQTRLPAQVLVQRINGHLSADELNLLAMTDYVSGLPVVDLGNSSPIANSPTAESPNLFMVVGSKADFEYQFPAAPKFFVGRETILSRLKGITANTNQNASVIVLNAQSGWGKSSLALRLADQVEKAGGFSAVFDTRTALSVPYVSAALRKVITEASAKGKLAMPESPSFASLQSALNTLQKSYAAGKKTPVLIFFDQFENVFRNTKLTQEFRDLALGIREIEAPVTIGFSWKTDLVGLTEGYPYQLRDEIRGAALVQNIEPFGPKEVGTLLGRLAAAANTKLSLDLRQRLREYSQGLPWLLKKLANHILTQLQAGTSEEELLAEALNIEGLFEQDLASLGAQEIEAIKLIAREAPVAVSDIVEKVSPDIIQSLVDQRLLVRVGERLDTYWDTFREFLISGKVAIEDTYILRQRARGTSNLLRFLVSCGGEVSTSDAAKGLNTSANVIFNASRDLRQLGILTPKTGSLVLTEQLRNGKPSDIQIKERVNKALRRHKVFGLMHQLISDSGASQTSVSELASRMPSLFPAMEATEATWKIYAMSFATWFDYANLFQMRGQLLSPTMSINSTTLLDVKKNGSRRTFPQTRPSIAFQWLYAEIGTPDTAPLAKSAASKSISDFQVLGLIGESGTLERSPLIESILDAQQYQATLKNLLMKVPGGTSAINLLETAPESSSEKIGALLRDAYGLPWADTTTKMAGSKFRAWAAHAGIFLSTESPISARKKANK